jgi:hypothetical protein
MLSLKSKKSKELLKLNEIKGKALVAAEKAENEREKETQALVANKLKEVLTTSGADDQRESLAGFWDEEFTEGIRKQVFPLYEILVKERVDDLKLKARNTYNIIQNQGETIRFIRKKCASKSFDDSPRKYMELAKQYHKEIQSAKPPKKPASYQKELEELQATTKQLLQIKDEMEKYTSEVITDCAPKQRRYDILLILGLITVQLVTLSLCAMILRQKQRREEIIVRIPDALHTTAIVGCVVSSVMTLSSLIVLYRLLSSSRILSFTLFKFLDWMQWPSTILNLIIGSWSVHVLFSATDSQQQTIRALAVAIITLSIVYILILTVYSVRNRSSAVTFLTPLSVIRSLSVRSQVAPSVDVSEYKTGSGLGKRKMVFE